ncbi:hypothetical protein N7468_004729 [Penicillium chermesinum]|uniref:non-specific serine/threonine protein kinase n=1 Tax=Penicillium chermesinum TaxID=63820 RepID=A0A9W9P931_9EURO|nr:uncharacterized protein N7468_004729 [Penicillium chermesinum]KAJ5240110.1 hypothetical protein N7468_004729 [Penicillium chermesinum]
MADYKPPPLPSPFSFTQPAPTLLTQGAEAHLYKTVSLDPSIPAALKIRPSKPYRHPILDRKLTRQRIVQEARCLVKLIREGVKVPALLALDWEGQGGDSGWGGAWLLMEWIEGPVVRVVLEQWEAWMKQNSSSLDEAQRAREEDRVRDLLNRMGAAGAEMWTPMGLLWRGEIVIIDLGLASQSTQDEDRAVDLYVLERAIGSTHPRSEALFDALLQGYRESYKGATSTLKRLEDVRMRGRKRSMLG